MSLYESAYTLFVEYIYGNPEVLSADQTITLTILSTLAAIFIVALPFILVWRIVKGLVLC